jgi:hypothetical protein
MAANIKGTTSMVRKTDKEHIPGKMVVITRVTGPTISLVVLGFIFGLMGEYTKDNSSTIKCMVVVFTHGKMGENIKVSISLIRNMVLVLTLGRQEGSMLENGRMVKEMEEEKF